MADVELSTPCGETSVEIAEKINVEFFSPSFDPPPPADASVEPLETFKDDVKLIHKNTLSAASSYVIETSKVSAKIVKPSSSSVIERPLSAREKRDQQKLAVKNKMAPKTPHKLGQIPKYLQKRKEESALASRNASLEKVVVESRPKTVESSMRGLNKSAIKVQFGTKEKHGDLKSQTSAIVTKSNLKIVKNQSSVALLTRDNEVLKSERDKLKIELNEKTDHLKVKVERVKNLEAKIARLQKEQKQEAENVEKILAFENEVGNLKKSIESLNGRLKVKDEVINRLKIENDKLNGEIKMQTSSNETLTMEKNHLQTLLNQKEKSGGDSALAKEVVSLNEKLKVKSNEIQELKAQLGKLSEKNNSTKSTPKSSHVSLKSDVSEIQEQNSKLKISEEKLLQQVRVLKSELEDAKNADISNTSLLQIRYENLKVLQEADNINKFRIVSQFKEIEQLKKQLEEFETFKLSHAEEKQNFINLLEGFRCEISKLNNERDLLRNKLEQKMYKHRQ